MNFNIFDVFYLRSFNINVVKNQFKISAFFLYNSDAANNLNFKELILNLNGRKLTLHGSIKIMKTLGLLKLIH